MNESVSNTLDYFLARLKEPSTWAGIAVFIGMFGLSDETLSRITSNGPAVITALATLIAIFAPSHKKAVTVTAGQVVGGTALLDTEPATIIVANPVTPAPAEPGPAAPSDPQ